MADSNSRRADYEVGYGRPPLHTRFRKGERRNSRGRPQPKKALTEIFKKVVNEKVTVSVGGGTERITKALAVLHANLQEALKGTKSAMANVYELINEVGMFTEIPESQRAYFAVPHKSLSQEEFLRKADEANRIAAERARRGEQDDPS